MHMHPEIMNTNAHKTQETSCKLMTNATTMTSASINGINGMYFPRGSSYVDLTVILQSSFIAGAAIITIIGYIVQSHRNRQEAQRCWSH